MDQAGLYNETEAVAAEFRAADEAEQAAEAARAAEKAEDTEL